MAYASRSRSMPPGQARRARHQTLIVLFGVIAFIALALFGWLAEEVTAQALVATNRDALMSIHGYAQPAYDKLALGLTAIGSAPAVAAVGLLLALAFATRGRRADAATLLAVIVGGVGLVEVIKHLFHQVRPDLFPTLVHETGYSFPSGHTTLSFCLYGFLAAWLVVDAPARIERWVGAILCVALAASIAASRLYLGVHWPSDVAAGMLVGTTWVSICMAIRQMVSSRAI